MCDKKKQSKELFTGNETWPDIPLDILTELILLE